MTRVAPDMDISQFSQSKLQGTSPLGVQSAGKKNLFSTLFSYSHREKNVFPRLAEHSEKLILGATQIFSRKGGGVGVTN